MSTVDDALQHHNREAGNTKYDLGNFTVEVADSRSWEQVIEWGNQEHWNIGFHDAECFRAIDPEGFFLARVDGCPVAAVSLLNYDGTYAVWGHYLVAPGERGKGYGIGVCKVASRHSGDRVTAGDAMPVQVENYAKDGSVPIHRTIHQYGNLRRAVGVTTPSGDIVAVTPDLLSRVVELDACSFPVRRDRFLAKWLFADGHVALAHRDIHGQLDGYGVLRPAPIGYRIGPLCAATPDIARNLMSALTAELDEEAVLSAFVPDLQPQAAQVFAEFGLAEHFHVVRMWRGPRPERDVQSVYAISSLEVG